MTLHTKIIFQRFKWITFSVFFSTAAAAFVPALGLKKNEKEFNLNS